MREIKFRGWEEKSKIMLDWGCINQTAFNTQSISRQHQATAIFEPLLYHVFHNPEIVLMQYTGLKDKNGKKIYEGDICKFSYISPLDNKEKAYIWVVKYGNGMYWLRHIKNMHHYDSPLYLKFNQIEVIGNTYENPELLE